MERINAAYPRIRENNASLFCSHPEAHTSSMYYSLPGFDGLHFSRADHLPVSLRERSKINRELREATKSKEISVLAPRLKSAIKNGGYYVKSPGFGRQWLGVDSDQVNGMKMRFAQLTGVSFNDLNTDRIVELGNIHFSRVENFMPPARLGTTFDLLRTRRTSSDEPLTCDMVSITDEVMNMQALVPIFNKYPDLRSRCERTRIFRNIVEAVKSQAGSERWDARNLERGCSFGDNCEVQSDYVTQ